VQSTVFCFNLVRVFIGGEKLYFKVRLFGDFLKSYAEENSWHKLC